MCHPAVGLVAAELERRGVVTASVTMLPEVTLRVRAPRALAVPYGLGYPLGAPDDPALQHHVLRALLALCRRSDVPVRATLPVTDLPPLASKEHS